MWILMCENSADDIIAGNGAQRCFFFTFVTVGPFVLKVLTRKIASVRGMLCGPPETET